MSAAVGEHPIERAEYTRIVRSSDWASRSMVWSSPLGRMRASGFVRVLRFEATTPGQVALRRPSLHATNTDGDPMGDNALTWRRTTHCSNSACLDVARDGDHVVLRSSTDPDGPRLRLTPAEFGAFLAGVRAGQFDDLAA